MNKSNILYLSKAGMIAALYAALTMSLAPFSYGPIQFRVSEALTVLPLFSPAAIPGLFVGCLVSNLISGYGIPDIVFGSLATLLAAYFTHKCKNIFLAPLFPVIFNAIIIGAIITVYSTNIFENLSSSFMIFLTNSGMIFISEAVICYAIGLPLLFLIKKNKSLQKLM